MRDGNSQLTLVTLCQCGIEPPLDFRVNVKICWIRDIHVGHRIILHKFGWVRGNCDILNVCGMRRIKWVKLTTQREL